MRIKKRSKIPVVGNSEHKAVRLRRTPINKILPKGECYYIRKVRGSVEYRTPSVCSTWPDDFRRKLLQEYVPPATAVSKSYYAERCSNYDGVVCGRAVSVNYPLISETDKDSLVSVYGTVIIDRDSNRQLLLNHDTDAARFLIVLCFLHSIHIPGIPKLHITAYTGD